MPLILVGVTHEDSAGLAGAKIAAGDLPYVVTAVASADCISEACVVSTDHRTEVYVLGENVHAVCAAVVDVLAEHTTAGRGDVEDHMYVDTGTSVVAHLLRVACGVGDAVVEADPIGVVSDSWNVAREAGAARTMLNVLFHHAVEQGRVWRQTEHGSVRATAMRAVSAAYELSGKGAIAAVVVGAGGAGEAVAAEVASRAETGAVVVAHPELTKAVRVAELAGGVADGLDHVAELLDWADVVFYALESPRTIIDDVTLSAVSARRERRLVICDLSHSATVAPYEDEHIVRLSNGSFAAGSADASAAFILSAVRGWEHKMALRAHAPVIAAMHRKADELRVQELQRHAAVMRTMTDEQVAAMVALSRGMVAKLLHAPSTALRQAANSVYAEKMSATALELFAIEDR